MARRKIVPIKKKRQRSVKQGPRKNPLYYFPMCDRCGGRVRDVKPTELRLSRVLSGLTLAEVASYCGVSPSRLSLMEHGGCSCPENVLHFYGKLKKATATVRKAYARSIKHGGIRGTTGGIAAVAQA